jgi:hypothetical protein
MPGCMASVRLPKAHSRQASRLAPRAREALALLAVNAIEKRDL